MTQPEIGRIIAEFPCLCGKVTELDEVNVFRPDERFGGGDPVTGWGTICSSCECGRQWNYHLHTYLRAGGIVETRVYLRMTKDLDEDVAPKKVKKAKAKVS